MSAIPVLLAMFLGALEMQPAQLSPTQELKNDDEILKPAQIGTSNEALMNFFRKRTLPSPGRDVIEQLAARLGSKDVADADAAQAELVRLGAAVVPVIRETANHIEDAQAAIRAHQILEYVEDPVLTVAAVRLLVKRRAPGAASVLLAFLPHAENATVVELIQMALREIAHDATGVVEPSVQQALSDKHPLLRATALMVLNQTSRGPAPEVLCKLLHDPVPLVRLQAALLLAQGGDAEGVTMLIALSVDLADGQSREKIEEFLIDLAGPSRPKIGFGTDEASRLKARAAWVKWWDSTP